MLPYEQYPEEKSRLWLSSFKKIAQLSWRTTRRNYKHYTLNRVHIIQIPSASPSFMGILSNPKSSEDTLINLYVIWNMLTLADLHETILTPVICHKHVRYHDGVTLYFSVKLPSVAPKKTRNGYFSYMSADFRFMK